MRIIVITSPNGRWSQAVSDLDRLDLHYEISQGPDGEALERERSPEVRWPTSLKPGELGCAVAHARLYRRLKADKTEHAVILEDDAMVTRAFVELLQSGYLEASSHQLVLLYHRRSYGWRWSFRDCIPGHQVFSLAAFPLGTVGYYVGQQALERLLEAASPVRTVADWPLRLPFEMGAVGITPRVIQHPPKPGVGPEPYGGELSWPWGGSLRCWLNIIYLRWVLAVLARPVSFSVEGP